MSTQPVPILSPNAEMQAWFALVLQAALRVATGAVLAMKNGMATVTVAGKDILLTAMKLKDYTRYLVTPEQLVRNEVYGEPIVLSAQGIANKREDQISALESARDGNPDPATKASIQSSIDQLKATFAAEDEAAKPKPPAPAPTPAASDAWRNLPIGTFVTIDGVNYVIGDAGGCGAMLCKRKSPPVAPPPATITQFKADCVAKAQDILATVDNEEAQDVLLDFLKWLASK